MTESDKSIFMRIFTNPSKDFRKAILAEIIAVAEQGDGDVQSLLGKMYGEGMGIDRDYAESAKWHTKAAEQDADCQYNIGLFNENGIGETEEKRNAVKDENRAAYWFRLSAAQGKAAAQHKMGQLCEEGRGVARNLEESERWFHLAALQGYHPACAVEHRTATTPLLNHC